MYIYEPEFFKKSVKSSDLIRHGYPSAHFRAFSKSI